MSSDDSDSEIPKTKKENKPTAKKEKKEKIEEDIPSSSDDEIE